MGLTSLVWVAAWAAAWELDEQADEQADQDACSIPIQPEILVLA